MFPMNWKIGVGIVGVAFLAGLFLGSLSVPSPKPPTDLTTKNRWSNPLESAYIGDVGCAQCHPDQAAAHAGNGHSKTFHGGDLAAQFASLRDRSHHDAERGGTFTFRIVGGKLAVEFEKDHRREVLPVPFAFGSGTHATTLVSLLAADSGEPTILEHRVSLFAGSSKFGTTPGQTGLTEAAPIDCFGRVYRGREATHCVSCHTTTARIHGTELKDLRPNVGCESCHGPGRSHAGLMESLRSTDAVPIDKLIRFGSGTSTAAEEIQLCGTCHRTPEMLSSPPMSSDPKLARFQPVGLLNSKCFKQSDGHLRCSTCHDPHRTVSRETENYIAKCVACHSRNEAGDKQCPESPRDNCLKCHMPEVEVHPGISFHDHWIRVRSKTEADSHDERPQKNTDRH
jgi:Cytochrome c554 and c-prime